MRKRAEGQITGKTRKTREHRILGGGGEIKSFVGEFLQHVRSDSFKSKQFHEYLQCRQHTAFEDVTHVDNNADGEHFEKVTYYSTQSLKMIIIFEYMGEHNHRKYCNNLKIFRADNVCSGKKWFQFVLWH